VEKQKGFDLSELKDWIKTIIPWLQVSLTVLYICAKVGANLAFPGLGSAVPNFINWSSLSEGIAEATGHARKELDQLMIKEMGLEDNPAK
jgi:hypothetical protein